MHDYLVAFFCLVALIAFGLYLVSGFCRTVKESLEVALVDPRFVLFSASALAEAFLLSRQSYDTFLPRLFERHLCRTQIPHNRVALDCRLSTTRPAPQPTSSLLDLQWFDSSIA